MRRSTREERYFAKVDRRSEEECWPWTAGRNKHGYGTFRGDSGEQLAHRYGYKLLVGPLRPGECVCHSCDNPPCQNPGHWFAGTHLDNIADMVKKGRHTINRPPVRAHASLDGNRNVKLTDAQVVEMRQRYAGGTTQSVLGADYGIDQTAVSAIIRGKRRRHVGGPIVVQNFYRRAHGALHHNATLSTQEVAAIRAEYATGQTSQAALGERFNVSQVTVSRLVRGQSRVTD